MASNVWRRSPSSRLTADALIKGRLSDVSDLIAQGFFEAPQTFTDDFTDTAAADDLIDVNFITSAAVDETVSTSDDFICTLGTQSSMSEFAVTSDTSSSVRVVNSSVADSVNTSDLLTSNKQAVAAISESTVTVDSTSVAGISSQAVSEQAAASDSFTRSVIFPASITETIIANDATNVSARFNVSLVDLVGASDSPSSIYNTSATITETSALTDSTYAVSLLPVSVSETNSTSDELSALTAILADVSETIITSETYDETGSMPVFIPDIIVTTEDLSAVSNTSSDQTESTEASDSFFGGNFTSVEITETSAIAEAMDETDVVSVSISESVSTSEQSSTYLIAIAEVSESTAPSDNNSETDINRELVVEGMQITDNLSAISVTDSGVADTVSATDELQAGVLIPVSLNDSLTASDLVSESLIRVMTVTESILAVDTLDEVMITSVDLQETAASLDTNVGNAQIIVEVQEDTSIDDHVRLAHTVGIIESSFLTDAVDRVSAILVSIAEISSITETNSNKTLFSAVVSESILVSEALGASRFTSVSIADSLATLDVEAVSATLKALQNEISIIADSLSVTHQVFMSALVTFQFNTTPVLSVQREIASSVTGLFTDTAGLNKVSNLAGSSAAQTTVPNTAIQKTDLAIGSSNFVSLSSGDATQGYQLQGACAAQLSIFANLTVGTNVDFVGLVNFVSGTTSTLQNTVNVSGSSQFNIDGGGSGLVQWSLDSGTQSSLTAEVQSNRQATASASFSIQSQSTAILSNIYEVSSALSFAFTDQALLTNEVRVTGFAQSNSNVPTTTAELDRSMVYLLSFTSAGSGSLTIESDLDGSTGFTSDAVADTQLTMLITGSSDFLSTSSIIDDFVVTLAGDATSILDSYADLQVTRTYLLDGLVQAATGSTANAFGGWIEVDDLISFNSPIVTKHLFISPLTTVGTLQSSITTEAKFKQRKGILK